MAGYREMVYLSRELFCHEFSGNVICFVRPDGFHFLFVVSGDLRRD